MARWARQGGVDPDDGRLFEHIPDWMTESVWRWFESRYTFYIASIRHYNTDALRSLERRIRAQLDWTKGEFSAVLSFRFWVHSEDPRVQERALDAVHETLQVAVVRDGEVAKELERILEEAGSAWRVADHDGALGLERRVSEAVVTAAEQAISHAAAGPWLAKAWTAAYGRDPRPDAAYANAVKAVEAAAQPVVLPGDTSATLGKMIAAIRDKPEKWTVPLRPTENDPDPMQTVLQMMRLLWRGQHDRHGSADESAPDPLRQDEAEAAVHLSVALVQLFSGGSITPR